MIQDYIELVKSEYGKLYNEVTDRNIDELIDGIKDSLLELDIPNLGEIKNKENIANCKLIKRNWLNAYLKKQDSQLNKQIITAEVLYEKEALGEIDKGTFRNVFKYNTVEDYKKELVDKLTEWKNDDKSKLTEFEGYGLLYQNAKVNGIKNDIINGYYEFILHSNRDKVTKVPSILGFIGVDTSNKLPYLTDEEIREIDKNELQFLNTETFDKKVISADESTKMIMSLEKKLYLRLQNDKLPNEIITQIALVKALKEFNWLDASLVNLFYTNLYNVVSGEGIEMYLSDIAKVLGYKQTGEKIRLIKDSLCKLSSLRLSTDNYEGNQLSGYLLEVDLANDDKGTKAMVYLGNFLRRLVMLDSTFNFNKYEYDNLSKDAQQIAIWLQNKRLKRIAKNESNFETMSTTHLSYAINIRGTNVTKNKKRLTTALEELVNSKLVINSFTIKPRTQIFEIEYIELPADIVERIRNKELKSDELVEGCEYKQVK